MSNNNNPRTGPSWDFSHGPLRVSDNQRFLQHTDGKPFFWLGDTAWELFHRLNREEAATYLEKRRQQGYTVIQAVCLAEIDGVNTPNAYGHKALIDNDPTKPNPDYFEHVDYIVKTAESLGLYIGMLPTWGDKVSAAWGTGPVVFNDENARTYGEFLGKRYGDSQNIIWIIGGDRDPKGTESIWRALAAGVKHGDGGKHIMTFHPQGGMSSSSTFHNDDWLDCNMSQSGHHVLDNPNYTMVGQDYNLSPIKPCLDGEPRYENHPINWNPENGWFDEFDVRQGAYWPLFAGAFGHTYGCQDVWQMRSEKFEAVAFARTLWREAIDLPGTWQMRHARALLLSRPFFTRIPDQSLIVDDQADGMDHIQATRASDGAYAFVYMPTGNPVTVDMSKLSGTTATAWWFDPRTGTAEQFGQYPTGASQSFTPPSNGRGNDWILVLDDTARGFGAPGGPEFE